MPAYDKWNEIYTREANYKDVKNKLQQDLMGLIFELNVKKTPLI